MNMYTAALRTARLRNCLLGSLRSLCSPMVVRRASSCGFFPRRRKKLDFSLLATALVASWALLAQVILAAEPTIAAGDGDKIANATVAVNGTKSFFVKGTQAFEFAQEMHRLEKAAESALLELLLPPFEAKPSRSEQSGSGRPFVALVTSATSVGLDGVSESDVSLDTVPLFMYLLPSLLETAEAGHDYAVVVAYDIDDPFFDTPNGREEATSWFLREVSSRALAEKSVAIELRLLRVNNILRKPGPAFIAAARCAYELGADYFLRIDEDTQLLTPTWTSKFIAALQGLGPPYGVVGPGGNVPDMLVHAFTHRTHMDIFQGYYYPPELPDWWLDKWMSRVYGNRRTIRAKNVEVAHHSATDPTRYSLTLENKLKVPWLLARDTFAVGTWMATHPALADADSMRRFMGDSFDGRAAMAEHSRLL